MLISYKWLQSYFKKKLPSPEKLAERIALSFAEVESIEAIDNTERDGTKKTRNETGKKEEQPPKAAPFDNGRTTPASEDGGTPFIKGDTTPALARTNFAEQNLRGLADSGTPFIKGDTIFDIKVLPDHACYALSHRGVAYEIGAILGLKQKEMKWPEPGVVKTRPLVVRIEAPELCSRYMARVVEEVTPKTSPWVREHLEAIGQRSINPIVDGANIVMFDMGQPLHAFDADKVEGGIIVRLARKGEKITTLDNREVALDESILIIADEKAPLAIAGIKGGKKAEVTTATRNLILESANFNASHIRKTSEQLGIRTDASKRFENNLSPEMATIGMDDFTAFLFEIDKDARVGEVVDVYPEERTTWDIAVSEEYIIKKLGMRISSRKIEEVLSRLLIKAEKKKQPPSPLPPPRLADSAPLLWQEGREAPPLLRGNEWTLTPPAFRMDLSIPEDIAEEVARIVGYDKIPSALLPKSAGAIEIPKSFYYEWKIREILAREGFSEVMTSSFSNKGNVAIEKPLAEDKKYARLDLRSNFEKALKMNLLNAPLQGSEKTCIFEIGRVFTKDGERTALAIGVAGPKKKIVGLLESSLKKLLQELGVVLTGETKDGICECILDDVLVKLPEPKKWDIKIAPTKGEKFVLFSQYPFVVRDIALFVSPLIKGVPPSSEAGVVSPLIKGVPPSSEAGVVFPSPRSVEKIIKKSAGELLVRGPELFDEFTKDGKKSLAFRLIFQSFEKTLTDEEVNGFMEKIYSAVKNEGWEVR